MKYTVAIAGRSVEVEITSDGVLVNGAPTSAVLSPVQGTPLFVLDAPRGSRTYAMVRTAAGWGVQRAGEAWTVTIEDERARALAQLTRTRPGRDAPGLIRAPMPGLVLRLEVAVGQKVTAGTGLVVLEAMKMENEIRSPSGGTVRAILVNAGQAVEKGASLVEVVGEG